MSSTRKDHDQVTNNRSLPFDGLRILSFAQIGQGPAAVQLLADFGADVIKVERPGSGAWERSWAGANAFRDDVSFFYLSLNRNQRSLTLNLKDERARDVVRRLVRQVDVVVENYRPGVMDRLGLGYQALSEINPRLIYCTTNGYGSSGPYRDRPGQDLLVQALSGMAATTGRACDPPTPVGSPVIDFHAAALLAFGICAALVQRERTGRGQWVETSLLEAAVHLQWEGLFYFLNGWDVTQRSKAGLGSTYHQAPYGIYRTRDGYMALSISPLDKLAKVLELPALARFDPGETLTRRDEIKQLIESVTPGRTTNEWLEFLGLHDVWCGPVLGYDELVRDPQFQASEFTVKLDHPQVGEVTHIRPPLRLGGAPGDALPMRLPPELGEHTDEILASVGYGDAEIRELHANGTV